MTDIVYVTLYWEKKILLKKLVGDYCLLSEIEFKYKYPDLFKENEFNHYMFTLRNKVLYIGKTGKILYERLFKQKHDGLLCSLSHLPKRVYFTYSYILELEDDLSEETYDGLIEEVIDNDLLVEDDYLIDEVIKIVEKNKDKISKLIPKKITRKLIDLTEESLIFRNNPLYNSKSIYSVNFPIFKKIVVDHEGYYKPLLRFKLQPGVY